MTRTRTVLALLLFSASLAFAQPQVTRGGALKKRQYQTYGTTTLYVDGDQGSDSNACTDGGVYACATIQGAINKLPRFVQNSVTVNVAGAADGGVKDYAGFTYGSENVTALTPTTAGSLSVVGTYITAQSITGVTSGTITSYDGGGIRTDGGTYSDVSVFSSLTVSGAGWTADQLKDKFVRLLRSDGGVISTNAIYTNTSDTIFPAYQVTNATYAAAASIALVQPGTRINSTSPVSASWLIYNRGLGTITVSRFDILQKTSAPTAVNVGMSRAPAGISLSGDRIYYGDGNDLIGLGNNQSVSVSGSYLKTAGSRYFVSSMSGAGSSLSVTTSTIEGNGGAVYGLFSRAGDGTFSMTNTTMRDLIYGLSTMGCGVSWTVTDVRFIRAAQALVVDCFTDPMSVMQYRNYYEDIAGDAIWARGKKVYIYENRGSALQLGSETKNVTGVGMRLLYGAEGAYINNSTYGNAPRGAAGDFAIGDCEEALGCTNTTYTYSFLNSLTMPKCITLANSGTRVCN